MKTITITPERFLDLAKQAYFGTAQLASQFWIDRAGQVTVTDERTMAMPGMREWFAINRGAGYGHIAKVMRRHFAVAVANDPACPACAAQPRLRRCDECGVSAWITDCGHMAQPRPIAAGRYDGSRIDRDFCSSCASCEMVDDE